MARPRTYFMMPDIDAPDWKNPGKQHSFEEFYIPAKDEDGGTHRIYCNIPAQLYGWLTHIHASRKFPFQREGDMIRYFIFLGLCQLSNIDQTVPDMRALIEAAGRTAWFREAESTVMDHVENIAKLVAILQKHGAWAQIIDTLEREQHGIGKMRQLPDSDFWAKRWSEELQSRFGDLEALARLKCEEIRKTCGPEYLSLDPKDFCHDENEEV